jgi:carboxyl-terminal processing protease
MRRICVFSLLLASCGGGGGGGSGSGGTNPGSGSGWIAGTFKPASTFAAQCVAPRTGIDPDTGVAFVDKKGTVLAENNWLRSWTNNLYLWYREVPDFDPGSYSTAAAYFDVLKTSQLSSTQQPKDKFHFTVPTDQWRALAFSGVQAGYGVQWSFISTTPPRKVLAAYTEPGTPAVAAGIARGAEVLTVDGVDLANDNTQAAVNTLNAAFSPAAIGETHQFTIRDLGASTSRPVTLRADNIATAPVQNVFVIPTLSGAVGYMLFNDHLAQAEQGLIDAVNSLKAAGIADLVLDIRYNGGGFLDIASELAYMIAGNGPTAGKTFEQQIFNDKYPNTNPVTGRTLAPEPFLSTAVGFATVPAGQALPTLNLPRVFLLTGPDTCSASESIINGLRGVDVEVIQIGATTCGKPYGFYPQDNCGTTYFSIEFKGTNAKGFGDYSDGFTPSAAPGTSGALVKGCQVVDDFEHSLGDPNESRLATALAYRDNPTACLVILPHPKPTLGGAALAAGHLVKSPWATNRILRDNQ